MERPSFFPGHQAALFGFYHGATAARPELAFVLSHPFGEEKLWSHRVFVSFARELAERDWPTLRFDYMGTGDSGGELRDSSIESHVGDLHAAICHLRQLVGPETRIGVAGLRLGASVAALLAERQPEGVITGPMLLWDPIIDGWTYMQELMRSHLVTQLAVFGRVVEGRDSLRERVARGESVSVDGYELAAPLLDSCSVRELLPAGAKKFAGPTLVMQISPPGIYRPRPDLAGYAGGYDRGMFATCTEDAFWREIKPYYGRAANLGRVSLDWLEKVREPG
jgi:pimeloyl-ACP methyl ester carboxylesterase